VILDEKDFAFWLDPKNQDLAKLKQRGQALRIYLRLSFDRQAAAGSSEQHFRMPYPLHEFLSFKNLEN
jgi:hypothetical protein